MFNHLAVHGNGGTEAFVVLLICTVAAAVAIAAISYHFVERPWLRFKSRPRVTAASARNFG